MNVPVINFNVIGDDRGSLIALESNKTIPFEIKRIYYIYGTQQNVKRGMHAHYDLQQVIVCINGSCKLLLDNGFEQQTFTLSAPSSGLFIDRLIWRELFDFSDEAILLILASDYYNEHDYIRNYNKFIEIINSRPSD